jgi:hypothetical protein
MLTQHGGHGPGKLCIRRACATEAIRVEGKTAKTPCNWSYTRTSRRRAPAQGGAGSVGLGRWMRPGAGCIVPNMLVLVRASAVTSLEGPCSALRHAARIVRSVERSKCHWVVPGADDCEARLRGHPHPAQRA